MYYDLRLRLSNMKDSLHAFLGFKLKTVLVLKISFCFALNLFILLPPTFLKVAVSQKEWPLKDYRVKGRCRCNQI